MSHSIYTTTLPDHLQGYLLPHGLIPSSVRTVSYGPLVLEVIDEEPEFYRRLIERLRTAHSRTQVHIPIRETIAILAEAARLWLNRDYPLRRLAARWLPHLTGFAPAMIDEGLDHCFSGYDRLRLARLVLEATGRLDVLDRPLRIEGSASGPSRQAIACLPDRQGPDVSALIVAGNVPALVVPDLTALLLAKSACLIKPASREPLTTLLFAQTLVDLDHRLADLLAVAWWPRNRTAGGTTAIDAVVSSAVDCVVASGHDETIAALAPLTRRLIGYGDRLSVALIGAQELTDSEALASRMARDVCWYEQQGCLSPHLVYVEEGGTVTPRQFADRLAQSLARYALCWPQGPVPLEAAGGILQLRGEMEFRASMGAIALFPGGPDGRHVPNGARGTHGSRGFGLGWTVLYDPDPAPRRSPGYRTIWVKPVQSLEAAVDHLQVWRNRIESIGVALSPDRAQFRTQLASLGASRHCAIGAMQEPPINWRRGNRSLLQELLTWTQKQTD